MASFQTILLPTNDLAASRELYTKLLGVEPVADAPYYVGFDVDGQHIGLNPQGDRVLPNLHVDDLEQAIQLITDTGGTVLDEPREVGGTRRVAVVQDASSAVIGLIHDGRPEA